MSWKAKNGTNNNNKTTSQPQILAKVLSVKPLNARDQNVYIIEEKGSKLLKVGIERPKLVGALFHCTYKVWSKNGQTHFYVNQDNEWKAAFVEEAIMAENKEAYPEFIEVWGQIMFDKSYSERKSFYERNLLFDSSYENYLMSVARNNKINVDRFAKQRKELATVMGVKGDDCFRKLCSDMDFLQMFDRCPAFVLTMIPDRELLSRLPQRSWNYICTNAPLNFKEILVRWNEFKLNPYKIIYKKWPHEHDKPKANHREAIDELFMRNEENILSDQRIEYMIHDSIHFDRKIGREICFALKGLSSCYDFRNGKVRNGLVDEVVRRFITKIGSKTKYDIECAVFNFLKRVKENTPIDNVGNVIKFDLGAFYDESILKKEILVAENIAKVAHSDVKDITVEWDNFYLTHKEILDAGLSVEQLAHLRNMISKPFSGILGSAGCGKTQCLAVLVCFLESIGYFVDLGCMVGKASSRAKEVLIQKSLKYFETNIETIPRTIMSLYLSCIYKQPGEKDTHVLIIDESSTLDYKLGELLEHGGYERVFLFGDEKQLGPILGQYVLSDLTQINNPVVNINYLTKIFRNQNGNDSPASVVKMYNRTPGWEQDFSKCKGIEFNDNIDIESIVNYVKKLIEKLPVVTDQSKVERETELCKLFPMVMIPKVEVTDAVSRRLRRVWLEKFDPVSFSRLGGFADDSILVGDRIMITKNIYQEIDENGNVIYHLEEESADLEFERLKELEELENKGKKTKGKRQLVFANGGIAIVRKVENTHLMIEMLNASNLPNGNVVKFEQLECCKNSYAMTINKAQGSESEYTVVLLGNPEQDGKPFWFTKRSFAYTALTRHMVHCELFCSMDSLKQIIKRDDIYASKLKERISLQLAVSSEKKRERENQSESNKESTKKRKCEL